jgi:hypothetical protein
MSHHCSRARGFPVVPHPCSGDFNTETPLLATSEPSAGDVYFLSAGTLLLALVHVPVRLVFKNTSGGARGHMPAWATELLLSAARTRRSTRDRDEPGTVKNVDAHNDWRHGHLSPGLGGVLRVTGGELGSSETWCRLSRDASSAKVASVSVVTKAAVVAGTGPSQRASGLPYKSARPGAKRRARARPSRWRTALLGGPRCKPHRALNLGVGHLRYPFSKFAACGLTACFGPEHR